MAAHFPPQPQPPMRSSSPVFQVNIPSSPPVPQHIAHDLQPHSSSAGSPFCCRSIDELPLYQNQPPPSPAQAFLIDELTDELLSIVHRPSLPYSGPHILSPAFVIQCNTLAVTTIYNSLEWTEYAKKGPVRFYVPCTEDGIRGGYGGHGGASRVELKRTRSWYELEGGQPDGYEGEEDIFFAFRCPVHKWREWRFHVFEKVVVEDKRSVKKRESRKYGVREVEKEGERYCEYAW